MNYKTFLNRTPLKWEDLRNQETTSGSNSLATVMETAGCSIQMWHELMVKIVQYRRYPINERLIILGAFLSKMVTFISSRQWKQAGEFIEATRERLESGKLAKIGVPFVQNEPKKIQLVLLLNLVNIYITEKGNGNVYVQLYKETLSGLHYTSGVSIQTLIEAYETAHSHYYKPFIQEHEYIVEHYLVNYLVKKFTPYEGMHDPFDQYILLAIHYLLIKIHLVGMAGHYQDRFSKGDVLKLLCSFSTTVEQNSDYLVNMLSMIKANTNADMVGIATLLKD